MSLRSIMSKAFGVLIIMVGLGTLTLWFTGSFAPAILGTLLLIVLVAVEATVKKAAGI